MSCHPTLIKIQTLLTFFVGPILLGLLIGGVVGGTLSKTHQTRFAFTRHRHLLPSDHTFSYLDSSSMPPESDSVSPDTPLYYEVNCHGVTRHTVCYSVYRCNFSDAILDAPRTMRFSGRRQAQYEIDFWEDPRVLEYILHSTRGTQIDGYDSAEAILLGFTNVGSEEIVLRGLSPSGDLGLEQQIPVSGSIYVDYSAYSGVVLSSATRSVTVDITNIPTIKSAGCSLLATVETLCADNKRIRAPVSLTLQDLSSDENESSNADASFVLFKDSIAANQFDNGVMLSLNLTSEGSLLRWEVILIAVTLGIVGFFALHCSSCTIINLLYRTSDPVAAHHGMGTLDKNEVSHLFTEADSYSSGPYA